MMTISSFDECSDEIKLQLRGVFASWAKAWDESAEAMADDELKDAVDRFVFELWDSALPPVAPKFERPKFHTNTIRIGVFSKVTCAVDSTETFFLTKVIRTCLIQRKLVQCSTMSRGTSCCSPSWEEPHNTKYHARARLVSLPC